MLKITLNLPTETDEIRQKFDKKFTKMVMSVDKMLRKLVNNFCL